MRKLKRNERIKDVKGYEGLYAVTSLGRIWSYRKKRWMKSWKDGYGYMRVTFCVDNETNQPRLHRLVGEAFVDNPKGKPQINHINGIKSDCRASNLEWCTCRENLQHASDLGLNRHFKLSYQAKVFICQIYSALKPKKTWLAEIFGISPPGISYIIKTYTPLIASNHSL